jgi:hypothetical protein
VQLNPGEEFEDFAESLVKGIKTTLR